MKLCSLVLVFLLALHLLLSGAFGARTGKFATKSATSHQLPNLENENDVKKNDQSTKLDDNPSKEKIDVINKCKDDEDDCSSKGKYRKLITSTTMSTSTAKPIHENLEHGRNTNGKGKAQTISSSSSSNHRIPTAAFDVKKHKKALPKVEFENAMDMTVMDYSPAKKKPPIHN